MRWNNIKARCVEWTHADGAHGTSPANSEPHQNKIWRTWPRPSATACPRSKWIVLGIAPLRWSLRRRSLRILLVRAASRRAPNKARSTATATRVFVVGVHPSLRTNKFRFKRIGAILWETVYSNRLLYSEYLSSRILSDISFSILTSSSSLNSLQIKNKIGVNVWQIGVVTVIQYLDSVIWQQLLLYSIFMLLFYQLKYPLEIDNFAAILP